jgi:hypothetical protein
VRGPDGPLTVGITGTGHRTVILSNESDENLCSWLPLTRRLTALGDRVVLWDYGGSGPVPRGPAAGPGPPGALTRECPARRVESFGCG